MSRPGNETILQAVQTEGSIRKAAVLLGYRSDSSLRRWIKEDPELAVLLGFEVTEPGAVDDPRRLALASKDAENRQLRGDVRKLSELLAKREEWLEEIVEAARVPRVAPVFPKVTQKHVGLPERSIVLPIFDLQYGQHVSPDDVVFGKGAYSHAIFMERLGMYVEKVSALLKDRAVTTRFTELHIVLGGDLVEGDEIYPGMTWQLEKDPARQVLDLRDNLGAALRELIHRARNEWSDGDIKVAIYTVPGNHGKVGGKRSGARPATYSWDVLASTLILDDLREEKIDLAVNVPSGAILFETQGHTFLTIHGDEITGQMGIPFYGLTRFDGRAMRLAEVIFDYLLMGHIHQPALIPNGSGGEHIVSGDWVGGNNLSGKIVAASRPQQRVLLVGAKQGVLTDERIFFDDRRDRQKPTIHNVREV